MPSVRTIVVEDFRTFRQYVCSILQQQSDATIIGEAADGLAAVSMATALKPELILLDIGLPGLNGIEAARQIGKAVPDCKILILTQESAPEIVADKQQKVYYLSSCTPQISEANKIVFKSTEEAEKAGFKLARSCH